MYAPRVFISMAVVLIVFAVSAYFISGSVYTALLHTLICAVLLQVGYFVGVLFLVRREKMARDRAAPAALVVGKSKDGGRREGLRADAAPNVPAGDN